MPSKDSPGFRQEEQHVRAIVLPVETPFVVLGYGCLPDGLPKCTDANIKRLDAYSDRTFPPFHPTVHWEHEETLRAPSEGNTVLWEHEETLSTGYEGSTDPGEYDDILSVEVPSGPVPRAVEKIYLLWTSEAMTVFGRDGTVRFHLPRGTGVVGAASGIDCFPDNTVVQVLIAECNRAYLSKHFVGVKGIIFPKVYSRSSRVIFQRIESDNIPFSDEHRISSGVSLVDHCNAVSLEEDQLSSGFTFFADDETPKFILLNKNYAIRQATLGVTLYDPFFYQYIPGDWTEASFVQNVEPNPFGVQIPYMRFIIGFFCLLVMAMPGVIQFYGSSDNNWGDILNQVVGTGSVLLGAALLTTAFFSTIP